MYNIRFAHKSHHPVAYVSTTEIEWPPAREHPFFYIGIYAAISLAAGFVNIAGVITQYTGALRASRKLFRQLLVTVVRATMRWHDVTPQGRFELSITSESMIEHFLGRMLNRFSKDIETVDGSLASSLQAVNTALANFAASVITVV